MDNNETNNNRSLELCRRVVTTESLIEEAKAIHGEKYDYSKTQYRSKGYKIVVTCPTHGDFEVFAREHLDGKGCSKCTKGEKFIKKLTAKFGDKFLLDKFVYQSSTTPVELICPTHGLFSRTPNTILNSAHGCPECGSEFARSLNERAHADAEKRKAEDREERKQQQEALRVQSFYDAIQEAHHEINEWKKHPAHLSYDDFEAISVVSLYAQLVDLYIDLIRHNTKWEEALRVRYVASDEEKKTLGFCSENGTLYKFENESPCEAIINEFMTNPYERWNDETLEQRLSHRECDIRFMNGDLYIYHLPYEFRQPKCSSAMNRKADVCIDNFPSSFVGIDFETLYSQRVSACSVGMVKYKEGQIVDRYYSLIRPPFDYPGKCGVPLTWIHGFTEEMLQSERTFEEVLPEMETFVEGLPLAAHYACVERACIRDTAEFYGLTTSLDYRNIIDTYPLSKHVEQLMGYDIKGSGTHSLDAVCRRFNVPEMHHHNALDDAEMCGNLLLAFKEILSNADVEITPIVNEVVATTKINAEDKIQRTDLENVVDNPFKDKVVVFTGFAKADSQQYAHLLNELGAIIRDSVNKKTNILITGYNAGPSKLKKAEELGVQIMQETELKEILNQIQP